MLDTQRHEPSGSGWHWPETEYELYEQNLKLGDVGELLSAQHIMKVYFESLIRFYQTCSGSAGFPRLPKRGGDRSEADHAVDVVHEYFAKRSRNLILKWTRSRARSGGNSPSHLRGFIKHDFRLHCREMCKQERRYHGRAREFHGDEFPAPSAPELVRKETTRLELTGIVRVAIDLTLDSFPAESRDQLLILAENRLLLQRRYKDFQHLLNCDLRAARQRNARFQERLIRILRRLLMEHGDSVAELRSDLQ